MAIIALLLVAIGLLAAAWMIIVCCENALAAGGALLAGHIALATGGGWVGAVFSAMVAFAAVSVAARLAFGFARAGPIRVLISLLVAVPAGTIGFLLADGILWAAGPSPVWRLSMATVFALAVAAGAVRRLASPGVASSPDR